MKKYWILLPLYILVLSGFTPLSAWEKFDRVLAVVNNRPIIESEVNIILNQKKTLKSISKTEISYEKSRIIDQLIENELIFETARNECIEISDKRVINQLNESMIRFFKTKDVDDNKAKEIAEKASNNLEKLLSDRFNSKIETDSNLKKFMNYVEKKEKIDFFTFFEQMRVNIARQQIMSITVGTNPPSSEDAKKWFNKNREKLGLEVHVKHILIIPKSGSLADEKEANDRIEDIRKKVLAGESFEKLAAKFSQDPGSAGEGGDLGWQMLGQLDPYFANSVYTMNKAGQISKVFKSSFGYHIVKFLDKRPVTFEKVEQLILWKIYSENMAEQYAKWITERKKGASITIYMEDYIQNKK